MLQAGAAWLGAQLKQHCGLACNYFHNGEMLSLTLTQERSDSSREGKALLAERGIAARTDNWIVLAAELQIENVPFVPRAGDSIEWTGPLAELNVALVFPLHDQHCYRYTDPSKTIVKIFTVDLHSLVNVRITPVAKEPFDVLGLPTVIRGEELFGDNGRIVRLLRMSVYIPRWQFDAEGIDEPPINSFVDVENNGKWAIQMAETEWGEGVVKLALEQEVLLREYQGKRVTG
jgi:hypothetical protein